MSIPDARSPLISHNTAVTFLIGGNAYGLAAGQRDVTGSEEQTGMRVLALANDPPPLLP